MLKYRQVRGLLTYFDDKLIVGDTLNGLFVAKLSFPKV